MDARKEAVDRLKREAKLFYRKNGHGSATNSTKFVQALQTVYSFGVSVSEAERLIDEARKEEE